MTHGTGYFQSRSQAIVVDEPAQAHGRVEDEQGQDGDDDHDALDPDEHVLVILQGSPPALVQLSRAVDRAPEDGDDGESEGPEEAADAREGRVPRQRGARALGLLRVRLMSFSVLV